jgi:fibronectin type 3 domain-containing protein
LDDTTAVAGTLYHYWVKACVDSYCSDYSVFDTGWRRPLAPGNVDASDGTFTDKVLISWDPLTGATSYEVYRATSEAGTKTLIGSPTGTSFDDTTAVTGTLYHYWVKACVDGYCSAYSDYDTGWRNIIAPGNLQASNGSDLNKVVVTWDSSTDATSYKIYRATTAGGTKNYRGSRSGTSFNDTSAVPGKMYYYWVKACIGSKCSSFSAYDTGWRMLTPLSSIQASNGTYTDKVRVYWSTSWGATSYEVYRASSSVGTKTKIGSPSGTSLEDTSATPGITYYYWVKACSGPRCSDFSPHDDGWRNLTPPSNLQATHGSDTSKVGLTWDPSSGATSYNVYRATSEGGTKSLLGSPASNSFDDTSVTPGITYYYWVKACSGSRCSDFSSYDTGWRMLTAPSNVSATYGTYTDKIHISWDPSSGATSYRIYRATSDIGIKTEISTVSGTSYDDISALPGTIYYFWVKACRDARCSAYSDYDTGYRALPKPPKPTNVKASDGKFATKVQITWNLTPGASSYKVYRSTTPKGTKVYLGSTPGTSFDDTTASPAQAYYYRVKACNSSGCSPYSAYDKGWRKTKKSFRSIANHDGWVLESSETSNKGGSKRYTQMTLRIGDDPRDRQYCSIISFNTKAVPDGAVITAAKLKILKVNVVGTNPFTTHGTLWAAVRKGYFGTSIGLQASDFQASASASSAAKFVPIPSTKWYRARMKSSTLVYIDRAGFTQFRLCFSLDDNDDNSSDFIKFFSGNEANKASRPKLEVFYYVP